MIFSTHGFPKTIVTDNGSAFTSQEFQTFCRVNGIHHITSSPYHPSTNGLAERAVQSFKQGLKRMEGGSLQSKLTRFLFRYRITPHTTTGLSPAEMLMGRRPRSQLDLVHPDTAQRMELKQVSDRGDNKRVRSFKVMDRVFVRDFRVKRVKWMPGEITKVTGPLSYQVRVENGVVRRHVDSIRLRHSEADSAEPDMFDEVLEELLWPASVPQPQSAPSEASPETPTTGTGSTTAMTADPDPDPDPGTSSTHSGATPSAGTGVALRRSTRNRPPPDYYHY